MNRGGVVAVAAALLYAACDSPVRPDQDDAVASVQVNAATSEIIAGAAAQFEAVVRNRDGKPLSGRPVQWSSSDSAVARVSGAGLVTGVSAGTARIQASSNGRVGLAQIVVRPARAPVHTVIISPAGEVELAPGAQMLFAASVKAVNDSVLNDRAVEWASTQPAVAIVSGAGVLTAHAAGMTNVIASSEGKADTVRVTVRPVLAARIEVTSGGVISLYTGDIRQITIRAFAANGNEIFGRAVEWASENEDIARVSQAGVVEARGVGSADVTIRIDTVTARVAIDVRSRIVRIDMSPADLILGVGESAPVSATLRGDGGVILQRPITWSSSNTAVATVNAAGQVVAHAVGSAVIKATAEGQEGRIDVLVNEWDGRILFTVGDSALPTTLFTRTVTGGDGVQRTSRVQAQAGELRLVTTGVNSGRYEQLFSVWILTDGQAAQPAVLGYRGEWQYDYVSRTIRLLSSTGEAMISAPLQDDRWVLMGRVEAGGPELSLAYIR